MSHNGKSMEILLLVLKTSKKKKKRKIPIGRAQNGEKARLRIEGKIIPRTRAISLRFSRKLGAGFEEKEKIGGFDGTYRRRRT